MSKRVTVHEKLDIVCNALTGLVEDNEKLDMLVVDLEAIKIELAGADTEPTVSEKLNSIHRQCGAINQQMMLLFAVVMKIGKNAGLDVAGTVLRIQNQMAEMEARDPSDPRSTEVPLDFADEIIKTENKH